MRCIPCYLIDQYIKSKMKFSTRKEKKKKSCFCLFVFIYSIDFFFNNNETLLDHTTREICTTVVL